LFGGLDAVCPGFGRFMVYLVIFILCNQGVSPLSHMRSRRDVFRYVDLWIELDCLLPHATTSERNPFSDPARDGFLPPSTITASVNLCRYSNNIENCNNHKKKIEILAEMRIFWPGGKGGPTACIYSEIYVGLNKIFRIDAMR
jgi:hypothetical protein